MAEIINLSDRRAAKQAAIEAEKTRPTILELGADAIDSILTDWQKMAKKSRLNDYFLAELPNVVQDENYMVDLNAISRLEMKLGFFPQIFFPGTTGPKQIGWIVQFFVNEERVGTPELANEAYARCFALLTYIKVVRAARAAGYEI